MPCGCVNNKNLNKDRLSLELMQTLSIDEIINLYRQDYTLEESENFTSIYTLTGATPLINDVTAYWHTPSGTGAVLVLWRNTGGSGWVRIEGWGRNVSPAQEVKIGEFANCFDPILPLGYLQQISTNALYLYGFGKTYYCPNGAVENCTYPATCSTPTITATYPTAKDIPFMQYDGMSPTIPPSLSVTAGESGQLIISWGASTGPTIFAYSVRVTGSDKMIFGHVPASLINVTIGGLTNNYLYNVEVRAISTSNVVSDPAPGSGTPSLPTPALDTITTAPPSASINIDGTQPFSAACKDQYSATIQCPTLAWASGSPSVATINPTSGLATGVGVGTSNITTSGGGKTSSPASVLTVNPIAITCQSISNVVADPPTLTLGGTVRLTATVTPSATTTQEFDVDFKDVTTTLNTAPITTVNHIATFDWIPATSKTYSIKAYSGTCVSPTATPVTVDPVPTCTSLSLTSPSTGVRGGSITLSATMSPVTSGVGIVFKDGTITLATRSTDGTGKATYIWSIPTNATLGDHTISASVPGTNCTDSKVVSISSQILTTITISPPSQSIGVGSTIQLTAICKDLNTTTMVCPTLTWVSNNPTKATVDSSGLVTGIAEGTANVTASAGTVTSNASVITVTTTPPPQAGGGGAMVMVAVALVAAAMFMMKKPRTPPTYDDKKMVKGTAIKIVTR